MFTLAYDTLIERHIGYNAAFTYLKSGGIGVSYTCRPWSAGLGFCVVVDALDKGCIGTLPNSLAHWEES